MFYDGILTISSYASIQSSVESPVPNIVKTSLGNSFLGRAIEFLHCQYNRTTLHERVKMLQNMLNQIKAIIRMELNLLV